MHLIGAKLPRSDLLMAAAVDRLSLLLWINSEDGKHGTNRPPSLLNSILGTDQDDIPVESLDTAEDYETAWTQITGVEHGR